MTSFMGRGSGRGVMWFWLVPFAIAMVAGLGGLIVGVCSLWPGSNPVNDFITGLSGIETREVPGDADNFDPFGALPGVSEFAGEGAQLVSIEATFVRADGTMDLNADYEPSPRTRYKFVREVERPDDAPPPGVGGANAGPWYQPVDIEAYDPGQRRRRTTTGGSTNQTVNYVNKGMERNTSDEVSGPQPIVEAPKCAIADLFRVATERGAPADAVATVTYDEDGYRFVISGVGIFLEFEHDCALVE